MKSVKLNRTSDDGRQTLGNAETQDEHGNVYLRFASLELPWKNNERQVSCIPAGKYKVIKRYSQKYGNHFHVQDVPARDMILIHAANFSRQLEGCIAVGRKHFDMDNDGLKDVSNSRTTLSLLYNEMPEEFELEIITA